jgi:glycerol-3-phosphate acyltransferase PlsX
MRIGIDILGGDFAPAATVLGSYLATKQLNNNTEIVLIGDKRKIEEISEQNNIDLSLFSIVHTEDNIGMDEYPAKAFSVKPNASIPLGFKMLSKGEIDGFASAGNTGAMLVGGMHIVKSIPGIIRPGIAALLPKISGNRTVLIDVGLNPDCKPDVLYQYAVIGSIYAENVYGIPSPRVALLNIGSEEEKGNLLTKSAFQAMKGTRDFNFVGNIEGNDIFDDNIDVIVCDGFVGNVIIKEAEALYSLLKSRNLSDEYIDKFNFESYGGTPILGINAPAIIGHGVSGEVAIKNMILQTADVVQAKLSERIKDFFK